MVHVPPPSVLISTQQAQDRHDSLEVPLRMSPLLRVMGLFLAGPNSPAGRTVGGDHVWPPSRD